MQEEELDFITTLTMLRFRAQITHREQLKDKQTFTRAFEMTRSFLISGYKRIKAGQGEIEVYYDENQVIRAYIMYWKQEKSWYGPPIQTCTLDFDWKEQSAISWVTQKLFYLQSELHGDCELMLSAHYASILGVALNVGFKIDSVLLLGHPQTSLQHLIEDKAPSDHLGFMNLSIYPLNSQKEIRAIVKLKKNYFTDHPEFCWFGADERHLHKCQQDLSHALRQSKRGQTSDLYAWVIYREQEVLGYFSFQTQSDHPLWGHYAGLDIVLHPRIQKRGVVKTIYRLMLEQMIIQGVQIYKGGTSQPAVMGLGRLMQRPLFSWILRKNAVFDPSHFALYLPNQVVTPNNDSA